jgi:hypothetical protein
VAKFFSRQNEAKAVIFEFERGECVGEEKEDVWVR